MKMQKEQTAFFSHEFDSNVLLAVNDIGIHVIDAFSMVRPDVCLQQDLSRNF